MSPRNSTCRSATSGYTAVILGTAGYCVTALVAALLSDRIGRRKLFLLAAPVVAVIAVVPIFLLIQTANFAAITLALVIVGVILGTLCGSLRGRYVRGLPHQRSLQLTLFGLQPRGLHSRVGGTTPLTSPPSWRPLGQPDLARLLPHRRRPCRHRRRSDIPRDRQGALA